MIAACGLVCSECDAYKATQSNDPGAIARTAEEWSKIFNSDVKPEYVWCDGCLSESDRKCGNCAGCRIRACVLVRGLSNCAGCDDYACEDIKKLFDLFPSAKETLEKILTTQ